MMRTISYPVAGSSLLQARPITAEPNPSRIPVRFLATSEEVRRLRRSVRVTLLIVGFILVMAGSGWAQQQEVTSIKELKEQIAKLEAVDRDENTPDEVRSVNRSFLEGRRAQLKALLEKRVKALQSYLENIGSSLTADEKQRVESSIKSVEVELQNLGRNTQASMPTKSSASSTTTSNLIASTQPSNVAISTSIEPVSVKSDLPPLTDKLSKSTPVVPTGCTITITRPPDASYTVPTLQALELEISVAPPTCTKKLLIKVENKSETIDQKTVDVAGGGVKTSVKFRKGTNTITVMDDEERTNVETVTLNCQADDCGEESSDEDASAPTPFTRAIIGLEQSAAASADPEQNIFLEFNLTAPLFKGNKKPIYAPFWLWLNPRITSLPQQRSSPISDFATSSNFFNPFLTGNVNDIAQGFEFLGGIEVPFWGPSKDIPHGLGPKTRARFGLSFVVGGGAITPFNPQRTQQVFKVNQTVIDRFPNAKDKEFIAFVSPDRNRFFRQYYGGLRLKTYFVKNEGDKDELENIFPGVIDLTFGQNESVTRGVLRGGIVRIEGIYPLPFGGDNSKGFIYAFGSALMKLSRAKVQNTVILQLPDAVVPIPGDNVLIETTEQIDRDYYRIGIGVDLMRLIRRNN